jgi:hypothetical protein
VDRQCAERQGLLVKKTINGFYDADRAEIEGGKKNEKFQKRND